MIRALINMALIFFLFSISPVYGAERERLIIGVVPEVNLVKQMDRFVPLSNYLDSKTGMDIEIKPLSNYGQLFEDLRDGRIDGGFFGSLVYGITHTRIGIIPIARPVNLNGRSTYTDTIFIRKDKGINRPADMKGKTIALADPATTCGYLAQKAYFADKGIDIDKDMRILWTGSHEAAIQAVLSNQAELGGAKSTVVAKHRKANRVFDSVVDIYAESMKNGVPDNTLAVRKGLNTATIKLLKKTLLEMDRDPKGQAALRKFGALRFVQTTDADFKPLYDLAAHMKINLGTYQYKKEQSSQQYFKK